MTRDGTADDAIATVTHARMRLGQGDVSGARRILDTILEAEPGHLEAEDLLRSLDDAVERPPEPESEAPIAPAVSAEPDALAARFRAALGSSDGARDRRLRRLHAWLESVRGRVGERDA